MQAKVVTLADVEDILLEASRITNHRHFIIAGSLSVLGAVVSPPDEMCHSVDVDLYPKFDPGRAGEIAAAIGEGSKYFQDHGVYADAISPAILSLPDMWESRLMQIPSAHGIVGWFLDPNDAAISKLVRGEPRDVMWVKAGIDHGIIDPAVIRTRLPSTGNVMDGEVNQALSRLVQILGKPSRGRQP